jgi:hypothetical protein
MHVEAALLQFCPGLEDLALAGWYIERMLGGAYPA